jgi:hypothetical protein
MINCDSDGDGDGDGDGNGNVDGHSTGTFAHSTLVEHGVSTVSVWSKHGISIIVTQNRSGDESFDHKSKHKQEKKHKNTEENVETPSSSVRQVW